VVAKYNALFGRESAIWKSNLGLAGCSAHAKREGKLCGHLKINIEELWSKLHGTHMRVEMAYIESPVDSAFDLCATFFANFIKIGMVPEVGKGSREPAVTIEKARGASDGPPTVILPLAIEREMNAYIFSAVLGGSIASPWARDHQCCASGEPFAQ